MRESKSFRRKSATLAALALACAVAASAAMPQKAHVTIDRTQSATTHASALRTLVAFKSDAELAAFLRRLIPKTSPRPIAEPAPALMADATQGGAETTSRASAQSITNNQEAGVDEGDIVKLKGDVLVILRRGRLYSISLAHGGMKPVDSIDAYPPGVDARDDWYDEMLLAANRIVVIGYSYARGGTEINRFDLSDDGHFKFHDAYQLRSNDYYSERNYASRLIGDQLVLYSPLYLPPWGEDPLAALPALRHWSGNAQEGFRRIASASQVYIPPSLMNSPDAQISALHTVTSCDVAANSLACLATSVLGPDSRTFYVSPRAVYVWVSEDWAKAGRVKPDALLYRLPLDGARPTAIAARGAPVDQFSFREDKEKLNVLVRSEGAGDAMWRSEFSAGAVALLSFPLSQFGDGSREVAASSYRDLPKPDGDEYSFHDRFVGDFLLYGTGNSWGAPEKLNGTLTVVSLKSGDATRLNIGQGIDRIEAMGNAGLVVGSDDHNTYLSAVDFYWGKPPMLGDRYVQAESAQAETRSHGFFFYPDVFAADGSTGVLGLPIARPARPAYHQLFESSAAMIFVRRAHAHFSGLGELDATNEGIADDGCEASCVDWYGNARPIFVGKRTFALLGYELIEGKLSDTAIRETARVSFAPRPPLARRAAN